ncbi:glycosyltransferase family 39 protein [Streptomyces sp. NPDC004752]
MTTFADDDHATATTMPTTSAATSAAAPAAKGRAGERCRAAVPLVVPAAVALVLGLWGITRQDSMWRDESVTYQVAHRSLPDVAGLLGHIDAVHGLYYVLMHAVFALWDGGLVALRLPSTLATAVAAAGVGAIGTRLAGRRSGVCAGLVFALLPITQQYAQEGRSYALVTACVTWATYLFLRGIRSPRAGWWAAYAVVLGVGCWLHEFAALALVAHALTLWRLRVPGRMWRRWAAAAACVLVSVLPLAVVSAAQADRQLGWLGRPSLAMWLQFLGISVFGTLLCRYLVRGGPDPESDTGTESGTGTGTEAGTAVATLALPLLVAPPALLMTGSLVKPWYVDRYVLYSMVGLALPAGAALDRLLSRRWRLVPVLRVPVVCLLAVGLAAAWLPAAQTVRSPHSRKDDVNAVARTVERFARPGDGVLFLPSRRREWLLSHPSVYHRLEDLALAKSPVASNSLQGTELSVDAVRRRILASDRVIALADPVGQPLDPFAQEVVKRRTLKTYFQVCERAQLWGAQVIVYARNGRGDCTSPGA